MAAGASANAAVFANWNRPSEPPGAATTAALGPAPNFRSSKDYLLSGHRTGVETQFPDGYLGPMEGNRRADKILGHIERMNLRQYSRGVHKGERINPSDYIWPQEFGKFTSLELESKGAKFAPVGTYSPTLERPISMAYVDLQYAEVGTEVEVDIRGKSVSATVCCLPFYKRTG